MKKILFFTFGILLISSCNSKDPIDNQDNAVMIIGSWEETAPCEACNVFTFMKNGVLLIENQNDDISYKINYEFISTDSIRVDRLWEIEEEKKITLHKVNFSSENTLFLEQFMPVDYGTTGFEDITLIKLN